MRPCPRAKGFRWTLLAAVGLAAALGSFAQEPGEARRSGIFFETLGVHLTNVEVYVTRDGNAVDDLVVEDFEIFDDGEPVEITHFSRVEAGRRVATSEDVPGEGVPTEDVPAGEVARPETGQTSTLVILVDQFLLSPGGRKRVLDGLSRQLDRLMSDDTRVIVVNKGLRLEVVLAPTSDPAGVRAALGRLAGQATRNPAGDSREVIRGIQRLEQAASEEETVVLAMARSSFLRLRRHSQQLHSHIRTSLGLLERFVGSLGGLEGRKAVVYVADRLPVRPAEHAWRLWFDAFGEQFGPEFGVTSPQAAVEEFDVSGELQNLIAEASTHRVIFYPTGVGRSIGDVSSAQNARRVGHAGRAQDGLRWLAEGTGGKAAVGRFDPDAFFGRLHQDLNGYYSLGYRTTHGGDGEVHRVEVKVRRAGVEVRYHRRYRDRSQDLQLEDLTLASLQFGVGENPLEVEVTHGEPEKEKGGRFVLPLTVRFPIANLVLLADRKTHNGKVSIRVVALDEKGRFSDPVTHQAPIEIPHEGMLQALSRQAIFRAELTLRRGRQTIAVDVRDEVGAVSSTVLVEVDVAQQGRQRDIGGRG